MRPSPNFTSLGKHCSAAQRVQPRRGWALPLAGKDWRFSYDLSENGNKNSKRIVIQLSQPGRGRARPCPALRCAAWGVVVGRGLGALLTDADTGHSKLVRNIGYPCYPLEGHRVDMHILPTLVPLCFARHGGGGSV
jgi:hypothetical protein